MMNFLIAPDFAPERFAGWYMLNAVLQKNSGVDIHLFTPTTTDEQNYLLEHETIHLIYANPFDSASLVREQGFKPMVKPCNAPNEAIILTQANSPIQQVADLKKGSKIAVTNNQDIKLIGLRLLEPADLVENDIEWVTAENHQMAIRTVLNGEADACFLLASVYHSLAELTQSKLHVLVESLIEDISHVLLISPSAMEAFDSFQAILTGLSDTEAGKITLEELGFEQGFVAMEDEEMEFMIDLMETLI